MTNLLEGYYDLVIDAVIVTGRRFSTKSGDTSKTCVTTKGTTTGERGVRFSVTGMIMLCRGAFLIDVVFSKSGAAD